MRVRLFQNNNACRRFLSISPDFSGYTFSLIDSASVLWIEFRTKMKRIISLILVLIILIAGCSGDIETETPAEVRVPEEKTAPRDSGIVEEEDEQEEPGIDEPEIVEEVFLTEAPADIDDISYIYPLGLMFGSHVTPVDHQYYFWNDLDVLLERFPVYSPADGYAIHISYLRDNNDYIVFLEHSEHVQVEYIHLERLAGPIEQINGTINDERGWYGRIPVKAGEIIAYDGGTNGFDFSVHDYSMTLPGFINPDTYVAEPWKIHTADPYDYFIEPLRSRLLEKNVRQVEPLGGKIDYDIPGRLIGNWFEEGSNGYAGKVYQGPLEPGYQVGYWNSHLAIAPDAIDPSAVIVSIGWFNGISLQSAVNNLYIRPEDVSVETGIVKYELIDWGYVCGEDEEPWGDITDPAAKDIRVKLYSNIRGTVLFQLIEEHRLKMEAFHGLTADEVTGFTENARIYVR